MMMLTSAVSNVRGNACYLLFIHLSFVI